MSTNKEKEVDTSKEVSHEEIAEEVGESSIKLHELHVLTRRLEGKLLTICDATVIGERQLKSVKDLVRDAMNEFRYHAEDVSSLRADPYSSGVCTLDIKDTPRGLAIPTMCPPEEE